jgi:hypothetical protein
VAILNLLKDYKMKIKQIKQIAKFIQSIKKSLAEKGCFRAPSPIGGYIEYYPIIGCGQHSIIGYYSCNSSYVETNLLNVGSEMAKNHFRKRAHRSMGYDRATWLWYNV